MSDYSRELKQAQEEWPEIVRAPIVCSGPEIPAGVQSLIAVGSGCALPVAHLASLVIEEKYSCCAHVLTPYDVIHSVAVPHIALLVSAKGQHAHILHCCRALQEAGAHIVIVTTRLESPLVALASAGSNPVTLISTKQDVRPGGFIPIESTLLLAVLLAKAYLGKDRHAKMAVVFDAAVRDHEQFAEKCESSLTMEKYHLLGSRWGAPAVRDFETRMTEAGMCCTSLTDPWNFAHGRYMPLFQSRRECALSMCAAGEEQEFERMSRLCGESFSMFSIVAPDPDFMGALYCMIRSMLLVGHLCEIRGIDPASPEIPRCGNLLYEGYKLP